MKRITFIFVITLLALWSCKDNKNERDPFICVVNNPVAKEGRTLGIDISDLNQGASSIEKANVKTAKELEVDFLSLSLDWNVLQTAEEQFEDQNQVLSLYKKVLSENNLKLSLTIDPVNRYGNHFPEHLKNLRINNALVISDFKRTLSFVFDVISPSLFHSIIIGTELDAYSKTLESSGFMDDYAFFINEIKQYIKSLNGNIAVGFSTSHNSLIYHSEEYEKLYESTDVLAVDFFPVNKDYTLKSTSFIAEVMQKLTHIYPDKPIYIHQFGVQDADENLSNEDKQAEMYCALFRAWDIYKDQIPSINIYRLNDVTEARSRELLAILGLSDFYRVEFYRTLGLRTYAGSNKYAFKVVRDNVSKRNW